MPSPITVKVKRLAHGEGLPLPQRMTEHSAGFDISAAVETNMELKPGDIQLIPCGFAMAIPQGYEAQIRPRSGLAAKHGITMINTPGTIDSDYRGEIRVPLINLGKNSFTIERGMRIAQMLICPVPQVALEEVEDLDSTSRGHGGFGHTGTK
jgi:dUTP pyrophosphatase